MLVLVGTIFEGLTVKIKCVLVVESVASVTFWKTPLYVSLAIEWVPFDIIALFKFPKLPI
mgnify:CR=1 FL=1